MITLELTHDEAMDVVLAVENSLHTAMVDDPEMSDYIDTCKRVQAELGRQLRAAAL